MSKILHSQNILYLKSDDDIDERDVLIYENFSSDLS